MAKLSYRKDIDGLRALAVLPILLFHFNVPGFSGGFVGVDIFFVISGFLITSIIVRDVDAGSFSFKSFWLRRLRRLLPAAVIVIGATLIAGWFLLAPDDYKELGRSARSQAFFAANFYFWQEAGYFDGPSELKPLLHTWSLALEEQFYLLFPLIFLLLSRAKPSRRNGLLYVLALLSLAYSIYLVEKQPAAAFYLLPTRAWELLVGSMLALSAPSLRLPRAVYQALSILGGAGIIYCIVCYDSTTVFPGASALLPVLSTAAILWANGCYNTWVRQLLSLRPLVWVGLLSYSLYLWHWPIAAYANYWGINQGAHDKLLLILLSVLLAMLTLRFIEAPFRQKRYLASSRKLALAALVCTLLVAASGQFLRVTHGYPQRLSAEAQQYAADKQYSDKQRRCMKLTREAIDDDKPCLLGGTKTSDRPSIISWGDSHTDALLPLYDHYANSKQLNGWHIARSGCPSLQGVQWENRPDCDEHVKASIRLIQRHKFEHVFLANNWSLYVSDSKSLGLPGTRRVRLERLRRSLQQTVATLTAAGSHVWIIKQVPQQHFNAPHRLVLATLKGEDVTRLGLPYRQHLDRQLEINEMIDELVDGKQVFSLDPADTLCADRTFCMAAREGRSMYYDTTHLSNYGALQLLDMLSLIEP